MTDKILIFITALLLIEPNVFAQDVSIDSSGNITTGSSNAAGNLEVKGASAEYAIVGIASGTGGTGVRGENTTYGNFGILGGFYSTYDVGVYGYSSTGYAGYFDGEVGITGNLTVSGTISGGETDPQVGTLLNGSWCVSDGLIVNCDQGPPLLTETDPTVPATIKDGIEWMEIAGRPAGLDDGDDIGVTGIPNENFIPKWSGDYLVSGSVYDNGKVGIGTTNPRYILDTAGRIRVQGAGAAGGGIWFSEAGAPTMNTVLFGRGADYQDWTGFFTGSSWKMIVEDSGNVGIGTTNPQSELQVNGYIQLDLTSNAPPSADCDSAAEYGRMKVDAGAKLLYICVSSGWVAK